MVRSFPRRRGPRERVRAAREPICGVRLLDLPWRALHRISRAVVRLQPRVWRQERLDAHIGCRTTFASQVLVIQRPEIVGDRHAMFVTRTLQSHRDETPLLSTSSSSMPKTPCLPATALQSPMRCPVRPSSVRMALSRYETAVSMSFWTALGSRSLGSVRGILRRNPSRCRAPAMLC